MLCATYASVATLSIFKLAPQKQPLLLPPKGIGVVLKNLAWGNTYRRTKIEH